MSDVSKAVPVRVELSNVTLDVEPGETLIQAAWRHGYYWPTVCGGTGDCGACRCEVTEGADHLGPLLIQEQVFFRKRSQQGNKGGIIRLACCLRVDGPVTVMKRGVERKTNAAS